MHRPRTAPDLLHTQISPFVRFTHRCVQFLLGRPHVYFGALSRLTLRRLHRGEVFMRWLIVLALAAGLTLQAHAARRLTVAQLEQTLASATSAHHADADIAHQLSGYELTERLSASTLDRLAAHLPLQPRTAVALQLLADQSSFLDPPPSEIPATAQPDSSTQQQILQSARRYIAETLPRLPNFFATRTTNRFDDSPQILKQGEWPVRAGIHFVGSTSRQVTFRDGKEAPESPKTAGGKKQETEIGLRTWGEFGPELSVIITDLTNGEVVFHHWETGPTGLIAVYRYSVPAKASHYAVNYCCAGVDANIRHDVGRVAQRGSNTPAYTSLPSAETARGVTFVPGYHGQLSIDPTSGAVLRITVEAELKPGTPITRAATVVEYGPVSIGERTFICPVRSLAISAEQAGSGTLLSSALADAGAWQSVRGGATAPPVLLLNETRFTDYHRLGSTSRIIADAAPPPSTDPAGNPPPPPSTPESAVANSAAEASAASQPAAATALLAPSPAAAELAASAPAPPPPATEAEVTMNPAGDLPSTPAPNDSGYSFKVTTRLVDVTVVATDKKGRPVPDLRADEIELYDNGQKQVIRSFTAPAGLTPSVAESSEHAPSAPESHTFSNRAPDPAIAATSLGANSGGTVLLIDESHIAWSDMQNARNQMLKFLSTVTPSERIGIYAMTGLGFRVLEEVTLDHAAVLARLRNFMPSAQSLQQAQEEERRNRQQFEYVHNPADLNSVNGNHNDVPDTEQSVDPELLTQGSNPARASLIILSQVARHLATIPGHKSLVWVSSDNVLADWQDQSVGIDKSPNHISSFALRAQETMNEAHASVYPFDVSQLEGGGITADLRNSSVQLDPASQDKAGLPGAAASPAAAASSRMTGTGRIDATRSQDLHPIQGEVRDVAAATGGRTIRRAGDLAAQLTSILDDSHATYQLTFSPQTPADDQYHKLTLKVSGRHGVNLRYRTGYFYAQEPATLKQRFQQAVWRPMDATEISVQADVTSLAAGATVKLNIAAADLGMQQQGGRWMDKLDLFFIQRDDAGIHSQFEGDTLGLRLKPATYQSVLSAGVPFEKTVAMRTGMAALRVLVVDENSGRMGSVTIPASQLRPAP